MRLASAKSGRDAVLLPVKGVPPGHQDAYRLSGPARRRLAHRTGHLTTPEGRKAELADWANKPGRISSTEAADLTGPSVPYAGRVLTSLEKKVSSSPAGKPRLAEASTTFLLPANESHTYPDLWPSEIINSAARTRDSAYVSDDSPPDTNPLLE
jgi:hypothetical protein